MANGKITQVIGTVVDVEFPSESMPGIFNALETEIAGEKLVLEVEQHVGNNWVRCLALGPTDGLKRGTETVDTGRPISVPVGDPTLGRLFNALGDTIDNLEEVESDEKWPIHRQPPSFDQQATDVEMLEMGIKVMDLIAPSPRAARSARTEVRAPARRSSSRSSYATSAPSTRACPSSPESGSAHARATTCGTRCRNRACWAARSWCSAR